MGGRRIAAAVALTMMLAPAGRPLAELAAPGPVAELRAPGAPEPLIRAPEALSRAVAAPHRTVPGGWALPSAVAEGPELPQALVTGTAEPESKGEPKGPWDWVRMDLDVTQGSFVHIRDFSLGIQLSGMKMGWNRIAYQGTYAFEAESVFWGNPDFGVNLKGDGAQVRMDRFGDGWWLVGTVKDVLEGREVEERVSLHISRYGGDRRWRVWDRGGNLEIVSNAPWGYRLEGAIDSSLFGRKKLAAVACAFASMAALRNSPIGEEAFTESAR